MENQIHFRRDVNAGLRLACLLGIFIFFFTTATKAVAPNPPPGPYLQSCHGAAVVGTVLQASCKDFFGNFREATLANYANCTGSFTDTKGRNHPRFIFNVDGFLRCVVDSKRRPNNDKNDPGSLFDVISVTQTALSNGGTETLWRIDRPQVWHNVTSGEVDYPIITFQARDQISFAAGGCVQTGGTGKTWKRYVNPEGPNHESYYWGTVSIPGQPPGFAKIGEVVGKQYPVPSPRPGFSNILKLGYLDDELDDNGYYRHDDGTPTQCAGEGPAWVVVTVLTGIKGSTLSPHKLPFDLVWDVDADEDENGLPMNPQWNFSNGALARQAGLQPHFIPLCGAAFPFPQMQIHDVREDVLREVCTSMPHDFDYHLVFFYCSPDPIPGHMNFSMATYTGQITWNSASSPQSAFSDGDWAFELTRPDGAGLAGQDDTDTPGTSLHLEFNAGEVALPLMPFWKDLLEGPPNAPLPIPKDSIAATFGGSTGLEGVVIGQIGLDGVHGGFAEIHPVYALAVRVQNALLPNRPGERVETWAFFLRNFGDEGFCSHNEWFWPKQPEYFISLPWPDDATEIVSNSTPQVMAWQEARTPIDIQADTTRRFSLIHVGDPGVDQFGVGGVVNLIYKVNDAPKQKKAPAQTTSTRAARQLHEHGEDDDVDIKSLSARIADPTTRAKFEADLKALPPMREPRKFTQAVPVQFPATITQRKHVPGAASKGLATLSHPAPNLAKQRWGQQMDNLLKSYQKELNLKPATPSQPSRPNSTQAPQK